MVENHKDDEAHNDDSPSEDDDEDLIDLLSADDPVDSDEYASTIRPDIVDRVFTTLSADAQRGDGELRRGDVNRAYLRKQLSIAECMVVEEKLLATGCQILDEDDEADADGGAAHSPRRTCHYLNEVEEKELGRRIQLALRLPENTIGLDPTYVDRIRKDAARAKATFVSSNIRYVEQLARRRGEHKHLSLDDIMQEGVIGLLRATDLYDPERGFRFKTYATWWIEQAMRRAIVNGDRIVRLPVHIQEKMVRIWRAQTKLVFAHGRPPTPDELAIAVGMEPERLMKLLWLVQATDCAEGDAPFGEDATLLSLVVDSAESPFDLASYQQLQKRFCDVLATLEPREERILRKRFGIGVDRDYTLESLGQQYDLTRERIRQIEAKALKKLRLDSRSSRLSGFLDS